MGGEGRIVERRRAKRLDASIPLTIKFIGGVQSTPPITAETDNISIKGLAIAIKIKTTLEHGRLSIQEGKYNMPMAQHLLLNNKRLKLEINILPQGMSIPAIGKVKWCGRSLRGDFYYVRAGMLIEWMEGEHRVKWSEFLRAVYEFMKGLSN
jgi:hypothetical protein